MSELFGIDLPMTIRSKQGVYPCVMRVPGWINFDVLRARASDNRGAAIQTKKARTEKVLR